MKDSRDKVLSNFKQRVSNYLTPEGKYDPAYTLGEEPYHRLRDLSFDLSHPYKIGRATHDFRKLLEAEESPLDKI